MTEIEVLNKEWKFVDLGMELWQYSAEIRRIGKKATKDLWVGTHIIDNEDHPHHGRYVTYTVPFDFWPATYHDTLEDAKKDVERQVEELIQEVRDGTINWWTRYNKCPYCGKYHLFYHVNWRDIRCRRQSSDDFKYRWQKIPDGIDHDGHLMTSIY